MKTAASFPGPRILVVDDEPANVALLRMILAAAGYKRVRGTTDSRRVLSLVRTVKPDLILLDLMMPRVSGFEGRRGGSRRRRCPGISCPCSC